jgi:hypothetical protein
MKKSIEEVRASVPAADRAKFDESLTAITTSEINPADIFSGNTAGVQAKVKESLAGKSASEIISAGQAILEERRAKEGEQASSEIAELRQKKQHAGKAKSELAKFKVTRSRFYRQESSFGRAEPVIELALTNNTGVAVSRAYFMGTLASPGRAVPWIKDSFNYQIAGGMESDESKELKLTPNMFGEWGRVEAPADAVLTVEVTRLDGPDGKAVFDSDAFTEDDAERLSTLERNFPKQATDTNQHSPAQNGFAASKPSPTTPDREMQAETPEPTFAPQPTKAVLKQSVIFQMPYGNVTLPAGTELEFVSRDGSEVHLRYMGSEQIVPDSAVDLK